MQKTQSEGASVVASWSSSCVHLELVKPLLPVCSRSSLHYGWRGRYVSFFCGRKRCCAIGTTCCICRSGIASVAVYAWSDGRRSCFCSRRSCDRLGIPGPRADLAFPTAAVGRASSTRVHLQNEIKRKGVVGCTCAFSAPPAHQTKRTPRCRVGNSMNKAKMNAYVYCYQKNAHKFNI